jgi:hypothetical protein
MKSEIIELRNELGWMEPEIKNMARLIYAVMECLNEIDSLRGTVNYQGQRLAEIERKKHD